MPEQTLPDFLAALQRLQDFDARDQRTNDLILQMNATLATFMEQQQAMVSAITAAVAQLAEATEKMAAMKLDVHMPEPAAQSGADWTTLSVRVPQGRHQEDKVMTITKQ